MKKYLVIQLARFGDILQTRRLIKSLQQDGEVSLCVDKTQEALAKLAYPDLDILPIYAFDADKLEVFTKNINLFDSIKNAKFDEVYTLNYSPLTFALSRLFSPEQVKGYFVENTQERRSEWVELAFKYMAKRYQSPLHIVDYWAFLSNNPISAELVNPSAVDKMYRWQEGKGAFQIALVLSGQNKRRSVPLSSYAQIIKVLATRFNKAEFILLGTSQEDKLAQEFLSYFKGNENFTLRNMVGKTSMPELFKCIEESDLVLSPDTGTLHCSAFLGTPTLSFFCSSAWAFETGAYGLGHTAIQATVDCAPCAERVNCKNVKCHDIFSSPSLLARMSKRKTNKEAENFAILESSFDKVGLIYLPIDGLIKDRNEAEIMRSLLFEYKYGDVCMAHSQKVEDIAANLFDSTNFFASEKLGV